MIRCLRGGVCTVQALCLRKLDFMREHWSDENFGLRVAVPFGHSTNHDGMGLALHPYRPARLPLATTSHHHIHQIVGERASV